MLHRQRHPEYVEGCFGCKIGTVGISPTATPTRASAELFRANRREQRWERDMPAYRRLRDDGLQPPTIDGAGDLEARAVHPDQVNTGMVSVAPAAFGAFEDATGKKVTEPCLQPSV